MTYYFFEKEVTIDINLSMTGDLLFILYRTHVTLKIFD